METKLIVQKTLDAIINVLAEEGRVELGALRSGMRCHFVGGSHFSDFGNTALCFIVKTNSCVS